MSELQRAVIDGVEVIWTELPGPVRAGLLFRAGTAYETLPTVGHTHLIEHMALDALGEPPGRHNGFVGPSITGFVTMGEQTDVATFVGGICDSLHDLPEHLLEPAKSILRAEGASAPYDFIAHLLSWRYGASSYGLRAAREFGTSTATIERLRQTAQQTFTRENAVLWMTAPPPQGLSIALPEGISRPAPSASEIRRPHPSWFVDDHSGGVGVSAVVPRTSAATLFNEIALDRLGSILRVERCVSYSPRVVYEPLDRERAHLVLFADSQKERRRELAEAFGEVFRSFDSIDPSTISAARDRCLERLVGPLAPPKDEVALQELQRAAVDWSMRKDFEPIDQLAEQLERVDSAQLGEFVSRMKSSALFAMPGAARIEPWIGTRALETTAKRVEGRSIKNVDFPVRKETLIVSDQGISVLLADESDRTVRYGGTAAVLRYGDGAVGIVGKDDGWLMIEPGLWPDGQKICETIAASVPDDLVIDQPAREPDAIPKPRLTRSRRLMVRSKPWVGWTLLAVAVAGVFAVLFTIGPGVLPWPFGPGDTLTEVAIVSIAFPVAPFIVMGIVGYALLHEYRNG